MTQVELARKNSASEAMRRVAKQEHVSVVSLVERIRAGTVVIPLNRGRKISRPCGVGRGLRTKVNANIGTSTDKTSSAYELKKLKAAVDAGADTVMDLSVGGDLTAVRTKIIRESPVPVGTVPIYEIAGNAFKRDGDFLTFGAAEVFSVLEKQAEEGVDFFTIHAGVTCKSLAELRKQKRILDVVSRGGALLARWMSRHNQENPFYTHFDKILDLAYAFDITLSLGDGLRPGSILDATDKGQLAELHILGELAERARRKSVQVMIEGPGHVALNDIKRNITLQKKICHGAPFYVLGPLVTDVAAGYDHITSAIGGALAASYGADFLCYVTPAEHLRHPSLDDVKEGVIAARIAGHAADIVKGVPGALQWDREMSLARKKRDWKKQITLSIDPDKARTYRRSSQPSQDDVCTMCGTYCSIKMMEGCAER